MLIAKIAKISKMLPKKDAKKSFRILKKRIDKRSIAAL